MEPGRPCPSPGAQAPSVGPWMTRQDKCTPRVARRWHIGRHRPLHLGLAGGGGGRQVTLARARAARSWSLRPRLAQVGGRTLGNTTLPAPCPHSLCRENGQQPWRPGGTGSRGRGGAYSSNLHESFTRLLTSAYCVPDTPQALEGQRVTAPWLMRRWPLNCPACRGNLKSQQPGAPREDHAALLQPEATQKGV